jgi:(p)ppGpp synthase/HD superfamily hydrolase
MSTLERAIAFAATAHEGQVDKAGEPYILHALRVMLRVTTLEERIVAVLHDVLEDCGCTLEALRQAGFPDAIIQGVDAVTRRRAETYEDFINRAGSNSIGRRVKLADLEDNCDLSRLKSLGPRDLARTAKYHKAIETLARPPV